jgi:hypothetical protein
LVKIGDLSITHILMSVNLYYLYITYAPAIPFYHPIYGSTGSYSQKSPFGRKWNPGVGMGMTAIRCGAGT